MLVLIVVFIPKGGIKIGLFPTEFKKKQFSKNVQKCTDCLMILWLFFEKCSEPTSFGAIFASPPLHTKIQPQHTSSAVSHARPLGGSADMQAVSSKIHDEMYTIFCHIVRRACGQAVARSRAANVLCVHQHSHFA